jgi:hypothetical protein
LFHLHKKLKNPFRKDAASPRKDKHNKKYSLIVTSAGKLTLLPEPAVLGYLGYYTTTLVICQGFFEKILPFLRYFSFFAKFATLSAFFAQNH